MEQVFLEFLESKKILESKTIEEIKNQIKNGSSIVDVLLDGNYIKEEELAMLLSQFTKLPYVEISSYNVDENVLKIIDGELCRKYMFFPLFEMDNTLFIAVYNPFNTIFIEELKFKTHKNVELSLTTKEEIKNALKIYYKYTEELIQTIHKATTYTTPEILPIEVEPSVEDVDAPIIKIVNLLFSQALQDRATDIHIDPEDERIDIKFRIDGVLHKITTLPKDIQDSFISRLKIMAGMDIAEKRMPQDGFIRIENNRENINIRVSTYPTIKGEKCVLRIFSQEKIFFPLENLGLREETKKELLRLISLPFGLILVTGPTGCGKTTTLYALLEKIVSFNKNILTIEDPVEISLPGIYQSNINPKKNWDFSVALKAILRLDPDVIMVGEIRDTETAKMVMQSALTGHLVLSTLHTKDSFSVPARLVDMGIPSFLVSASLIGVINQRLVRINCPYCLENYNPEKKLIEILNIKKDSFVRGKGCKNCAYTGFLGRTGVFEVLTINQELAKAIVEEPTPENIKKIATSFGIKDLLKEGIELIKEDKTTVEEVLRVCGAEEYGYISI
ncbi:MAG: GspE/PulE family protein [Candidatus Omnitrophica bacterium]|nr:GspE/PulE family protein [Candidatus Omnitrophota bacterium]